MSEPKKTMAEKAMAARRGASDAEPLSSLLIAEPLKPGGRPDLRRYDTVTGNLVIDEFGREIPDPRPMAPPVGFVQQESMTDRMYKLLKSRLVADMAAEKGFETLEESEYFGDDDDFDPVFDRPTPYEAVHMPEDNILLQEALKRHSPPPATTPADTPPAAPPAPPAPVVTEKK